MELKFECPTCGQHISATRAQIGVTAPCPNCNASITVPNASTLPSRLPVSPQPQEPAQTADILRAQKKRKGEFAGSGAAVQAIGLLLCFTIVGTIIGIPLLIIGGRMAVKLICSHCGNQTTKEAKICSTCGAHFVWQSRGLTRRCSEPLGGVRSSFP